MNGWLWLIGGGMEWSNTWRIFESISSPFLYMSRCRSWSHGVCLNTIDLGSRTSLANGSSIKKTRCETIYLCYIRLFDMWTRHQFVWRSAQFCECFQWATLPRWQATCHNLIHVHNQLTLLLHGQFFCSLPSPRPLHGQQDDLVV